MAEASWSRNGPQRSTAPSSTYGQPFNHRSLNSGPDSLGGFNNRRGQYGGSFGNNYSSRPDQASDNATRSPSDEMVREQAVVIDVRSDFGRILSPTNVRRPNVHIIFSLRTVSGTEPLSAITEDLTQIFQVGDQVEIGIEGGYDISGAYDECHAILSCSSILQTSDGTEQPELVPLLMIQEGGDVPLALTISCGLAAIHPQVVTIPEQLFPKFLANETSFKVVQNVWPEFAMVGHSVEARTIKAPRWLKCALSSTQVEKVALTLQRFGRDIAGFAIVTGHLENGVVLQPIDEDDLKECKDIFFPFEIARSDSCFDYKRIYSVGSKWYYRACRELPGRTFKYRAYLLDDLDGVMPRCSRPPPPDTVDEEVDEFHNAPQPVANRANDQKTTVESGQKTTVASGNASRLVETTPLVDVSEQQADEAETARKAATDSIVSESTLRLLSEVDFSAPDNLLDVYDPMVDSARPLEPCRAQMSISQHTIGPAYYSSWNCPVMRNDDPLPECPYDPSTSELLHSSAPVTDQQHSSLPIWTSSHRFDVDGNTLLLDSTPTRPLENVLKDDEAVSGEVLLLELGSESGHEVRKYNNFDETTASHMHFEARAKPKRTLEQQLMGCFDHDRSPSPPPVIRAHLPQPSRITQPAVICAKPCAVTNSNGVEGVVKDEQMNGREFSNGSVEVVKKGESLMEAMARLEAGDQQTFRGDIDEESSEDENAPRSLIAFYPLRVPREPGDDRFWFTSKKDKQAQYDSKLRASTSASQQSIVSTNGSASVMSKQGYIANELTMDGHGAHQNGTGPKNGETGNERTGTEAHKTSSFSTVLQNDDILAKFFTGVVKRQPF